MFENFRLLVASVTPTSISSIIKKMQAPVWNWNACQTWMTAERAHVAPAGKIEATCIERVSGILIKNCNVGTIT